MFTALLPPFYHQKNERKKKVKLSLGKTSEAKIIKYLNKNVYMLMLGKLLSVSVNLHICRAHQS